MPKYEYGGYFLEVYDELDRDGDLRFCVLNGEKELAGTYIHTIDLILLRDHLNKLLGDDYDAPEKEHNWEDELAG